MNQEDRRNYIGGSDIAAVVGLSPWKSPLDVYLEKTGAAVQQEPSFRMRWGALVEPLVLGEYTRLTGRKVRRRAAPYIHRKFPYMRGHVDGIASDNGLKRVVEAKTSPRGWDSVPDYYAAQAQWYMRLSLLPVADIVLVTAGDEISVYTIEEDREAQQALIEAAQEFWTKHVLAGVPPPPRSESDVRKLYVARAGKQAVASPEIEEACGRLAAIRAEMTRLEADERALRDAVALAMRDATELVRPDGRVLLTWTEYERESTDWQAVIRKLSGRIPTGELDQVVRGCAKVSRVRQMRIKGGSNGREG